MAFQDIFEIQQSMTVNTRRVIGQQVARSGYITVAQYLTAVPWVFTVQPHSFLYYPTARQLIQEIDNLDRQTPEYIDFDTSNSVARATGRLWWDNSDGIQTLNLGMAGSNATMQIGEEMYFRIKCSSAITEGQVVMFTGTVGASGGLTGAPATGLTASTAS